jgi:hypothetical protein
MSLPYISSASSKRLMGNIASTAHLTYHNASGTQEGSKRTPRSTLPSTLSDNPNGSAYGLELTVAPEAFVAAVVEVWSHLRPYGRVP